MKKQMDVYVPKFYQPFYGEITERQVNRLAVTHGTFIAREMDEPRVVDLRPTKE